MNTKMIKSALTLGLISLLMTGCSEVKGQNVSVGSSSQVVVGASDNQIEASDVSHVENDANKEDLLTRLSNAKKITVKTKMLTINNVYEIYIDGELVGKIEGKFVNMTGDVFKLKDLDGNVVKQEKQIKRWGVKLNRLAEISMPDGKVTGYIGEEVMKDLFSVGYKFHIYDENKEEIGSTKQNISLFGKKFDIYDMEGNIDYAIHQDITKFTSTYNIEVNNTSDIKPEDIVFYTAIQSAIIAAEKSK